MSEPEPEPSEGSSEPSRASEFVIEARGLDALALEDSSLRRLERQRVSEPPASNAGRSSDKQPPAQLQQAATSSDKLRQVARAPASFCNRAPASLERSSEQSA